MIDLLLELELHFSALGDTSSQEPVKGSHVELAKRQPQVKSLQGLQEGEAAVLW